VDVAGEMLELKNTINTMVDQLSSFAAEVTRVAKEVGTEGGLGADLLPTTLTEHEADALWLYWYAKEVLCQQV
jgi:hypothetical protein